MEFICGENREQGTFLPDRVEDYVSANNPVRVIDAYVESLDMEQLGFQKYAPNDTGRPMYAPKDLLKLYLYGYMNRVRSSRNLEIETKRNLEVIWLLKKLSPDHKTIARFRQNNPDALKNVFHNFTHLCMGFGLYGKELIAVDGSKFKAWNSKDRNFTPGKLEDRIKRINTKIDAYLAALNEEDAADAEAAEALDEDAVISIIKKLCERKQQYESLQQTIKEDNVRQISLTDPDSRLMKTKDGMAVCLNIQTAVDAKNNMIAEFEVSSQVQDKNQMGPIAKQAAEVLETQALTVVADAGYDSASDIADLIQDGFAPHVAGANYDICIPCAPDKAEEITEFGESRCVYLPERNLFICPAGEILYPSNYHKRNQTARYMNYRACHRCQHKCIPGDRRTAEICCSPSEFSKEYDDTNLTVRQIHVRADPNLVRKRKSIIEHVFGTVKRDLGISYLLLRGRKKVTGEISLAFTAFNMKRAINILGVERMVQYLTV